MHRSAFRSILLTILTASLMGCSYYQNRIKSPTKALDYASFAEAVFRRQNQATSQIMLRSLDNNDFDQNQLNLLNAEKIMRDACETLNHYANDSQASNNINLLLPTRMFISVKTCDQATQKVEKLLSEHSMP